MADIVRTSLENEEPCLIRDLLDWGSFNDHFLRFVIQGMVGSMKTDKQEQLAYKKSASKVNTFNLIKT